MGVLELDALIVRIAQDAGIAYPEEINALAVRQTYIAFLVRQGLRLTELPRIAGRLSEAALTIYRIRSPSAAGVPLERIALPYPAGEDSGSGGEV